MVLISRGFLSVVLVAVVTLSGCGGMRQQAYLLREKIAFKVGEQWVIKPPHQINATRIEVTRTAAGEPKADAEGQADAGEQTLAVDLTTGRVTFQDADGAPYPHQLSAEAAQQLVAGFVDRSWQVGRIGAVRGAEDAMSYDLRVYEGDDQAKPRRVRWSTPPARELPDQLAVLVRTFNEAHRLAHPLSGEVDLLE